LIATVLGLLLTTQKPFNEVTPIHLAILLNSLVSMGRDIDRLKKMKSRFEDMFIKAVFVNVGKLTRL
jgi:hypothetical protein